MEQVIEYIKRLPKDILHRLVYELMVDNKISYHELMDLHIRNMERLQKAETEAYFRLQAEVVKLACGYKKDRSRNIKDILQLLHDEGRINTTQEKIDKYK